MLGRNSCTGAFSAADRRLFYRPNGEKIISEKNPHGSIVKHEYNITQRLILTINFLASISTLLNDLQNDGTHRTCIPVNNPELNVTYYIYFLKFNKEKVKTFLYRQKKCKKVFVEKFRFLHERFFT